MQLIKFAAALIAGAVGCLAFAPFHVWPLAVLSPAVLMLLCYRTGAGRGFALGWVYGFGFFIAGVPWVYISIHEFGHVVPWAAAMATVGFAAVLACFPAFSAMLARRLKADTLAGYCLTWPACWVIMEWLRSWVLTGFPWLSLGYSQTDTWLAGLAPVFGVYAVSLGVAVTAGVLAALVIHRRRAVWPLVAVALVWGAAGLMQKIPWTRPLDDSIQVALLQGNFGQDIKWDPAWLEPQLQWYARATLENLDADVIVWPETALPAFFQQLQVPYWSTLDTAAARTDTALLAGMLYREGEDYYNVIVTGGEARGLYKKIHLVPLGEYFPLESVVRFLMPGLSIPMNDMSAGRRTQDPLHVQGYPVGVTICYEDAFGNLTRRVLPKAKYLVNVTNDAWFGDSAAPHQHLQVSRMLALQAGRPLIRAANTGISAIIGHEGELRAILPQFEQGVLRGTITPRAGATPWVWWGYWPVVIFCLVVLAVSLMRGRGDETSDRRE